MSFNPDTLIPGALAFALIVLFLHLAMRSITERRRVSWSFFSSCLVALLLPVLFGISLLVPGIILQLEELARGR